MNEQIQKQRILEYVEPLLAPASVEELVFINEKEDNEGVTNIWEAVMDTGEEYWVLEGIYPADIFKKSGIYRTMNAVYEAYMLQQETTEEQPIFDRNDQSFI